MAKFLDTTGISNELAQIIKNAKDKLILISPYLQICDRFKEMVEDKDRMKLDIRMVYRENKLQPQENNWLEGLQSIRTSVCKNLHAKCYINEKTALITSMNFYEFSQINNNEMGIVVNKIDDPELYKDIHEEAQRLLRISQEIKVIVEKIAPKKKTEKKSSTAYCIRCGTQIKLNPKHPYCLDDYRKWEEYGDKYYEEKTGACHICGKPNKSSMKQPICRGCYKKNKALFKD